MYITEGKNAISYDRKLGHLGLSSEYNGKLIDFIFMS